MSEKKTKRVNMLGDGSHHIKYPVYRKQIIIDENGDQKEVWKELSEDEKKNPRQLSDFANLGNGLLVPDVSHLDRFQAMDMLESYIDNLPQSVFDDMKGNGAEQPME